MLAIELSDFGDPTVNLSVVDRPEPGAPGPGEVLIQVEYAPLDHHDLLLARGTYPTLPPLPSVVGHEGAGTVLAVGPGVTTVGRGDVVLVPYGTYAWAERVVAPSGLLSALPATIDLQQASMLRINPATAGLLLAQRDDLKPGSWIALNAANSGVGRSLIATAHAVGLRTANLVRRLELTDELKALGADLVVLNSPDAAAVVRELVGDQPILLGLDGVGGESTGHLGEVLTDGGLLVNYAIMSKQPFAPDRDALAARGVTAKGFYMYSADNASRLTSATDTAQQLVADGRLRLPVDRVIPAQQFPEALSRLEAGEKVLLDFNSSRT